MTLSTPPGAFLQVNPEQAATMYELVKELAGLTGGELIWDIYSGVGGIAILLAQAAVGVRVTAIESYQPAAKISCTN
ncbi:MAG: 23S rRNA (uracil(1939)-C(5))-methyltransferase RlmD, partial [Clostridiales bacterium]